MPSRLDLEHKNDPEFEARWLKKLEQGDPPPELLKYSRREFRHSIAERWCRTRNPNLGEVLKQFGWSASYGDAERVLSMLKAGLKPVRVSDAPYITNGLTDSDPDVRRSASEFLAPGTAPEWQEALCLASLGEASDESVQLLSQAGFRPGDKLLRKAFEWLADASDPKDGAELSGLLPHLPVPLQNRLLAHLRRTGRGHLVAASFQRPVQDELHAGLELMRATGTSPELFWSVLPHVPDQALEEMFAQLDLNALVCPSPEPLQDPRWLPGCGEVLANDEWLVMVRPESFQIEGPCNGTHEPQRDLPYRLPRALLTGDLLVYQRSYRNYQGEVRWLPPRVLNLRTGTDDELESYGEDELIMTCDRELLYAVYGHALIAWQLQDGKILWQSQLSSLETHSLEAHDGILLERSRHELRTYQGVDRKGLYCGGSEPWTHQLRGGALAVGAGRKVCRLEFPSLDKGLSVSLPGLQTWALREDGSLLGASFKECVQWKEQGEVQHSWPQRRTGTRLQFHPRVPALVALGERELEWFHPGSELPDQRLALEPGKTGLEFRRQGELLALKREDGVQLWSVHTELRLTDMRPGDLQRLDSSSALWARFVKAALRYRYRNEVEVGDFEFPDAIMLD